MEINRYVIHELEKKERTTVASTKISERLGDIDDFTKQLVEQIHESFSHNTALKNTRFADRNDSTFKSKFEEYYEDNSDQSFYDFSRDSIKKLESLIKLVNLAKGGFYLYADYTIVNKRYILVVLLRKRAGLNIVLQDGVFKPNTAENLNIDRLAMGFRFNCNIYDAEDDKRQYIALIANQTDKVSKYFKDWVAAADMIPDTTNTQSLVEIVNLVDLPRDEDGNPTMSRDDFRRGVFDLVNTRGAGKKVNLKAIGNVFYGEEKENTLIDYAAQNNIEIDNEFKGNYKILRSLIRIEAKTDGIELKVDYGKLNANEVEVLQDKVIIKVQDIVDQVIEQIDER